MKFRFLSYNTAWTTGYLIALVLGFATRIQLLAVGYVLLATACVVVRSRWFCTARPKETNVLVALATLLALTLPFSVFRSLTSVAHALISLLSIGTAFILTRNLSVYRNASRLSLLMCQFAVAAYLVHSGLSDFPLENMLPDSSSNGVTSYLIILQANYWCINFLLYRRGSVLTVITTLCLCVIGYGRGSILAAGGILVLSILSSLSGREGYKIALGIVVLTLSCVWIGVKYGDLIGAFVGAHTKIGSGLYDEHRSSILSEYLGRMNMVTIWSGASYADSSIASEYNGNPHNSFIRAHYIFGLPYLLFMLLLPIYMIDRNHFITVKAFAFCMWLVVLFRAFTEPILFPTMFDFYYFAICFAYGAAGHRTGQNVRAMLAN